MALTSVSEFNPCVALGPFLDMIRGSGPLEPKTDLRSICFSSRFRAGLSWL